MATKILMIAQGIEHDRILAAIQIHRPDYLYILRNKNKIYDSVEDAVQGKIDELIKDIKKMGESRFLYHRTLLEEGHIKSNEYKINFFDLNESISIIDSIIKREKNKGNTIVVDISSGNKIAVIALFLVAQLNHCEITYHSGEDYNEVKHSGIGLQINSVDLPNLPIEPENLPYYLLSRIEKFGQETFSLTDLVMEVDTKEKEKVTKSDLVALSRKLTKLEKYGLITRTKKGGFLKITLTDKGKKFRVLEDSPSFNLVEN